MLYSKTWYINTFTENTHIARHRTYIFADHDVPANLEYFSLDKMKENSTDVLILKKQTCENTHSILFVFNHKHLTFSISIMAFSLYTAQKINTL